jgi:hypothetical protein
VVAKADAVVQDFMLYPNPAVTDVKIVLTDVAANEMELQLINQLGQVVKTTAVKKGSQLINLDVTSMARGMYVVKLTGNGTVQIKKLVVR